MFGAHDSSIYAEANMFMKRKSGINNYHGHRQVDTGQLPHVNGDGTLGHDITRTN